EQRLHDLLDETSRGLAGEEFDLQSIVDSASKVIGDVNPVGDRARSLLQDSAPLLDSQDQSADAIRIWTRSLVGGTDQLVANDQRVRTLLENGPGFAQEVAGLLEQLRPTVPILLANLITVGQLAVTYNPGLEQALVLLPPVVSIIEAVQANRN